MVPYYVNLHFKNGWVCIHIQSRHSSATAMVVVGSVAYCPNLAKNYPSFLRRNLRVSSTTKVSLARIGFKLVFDPNTLLALPMLNEHFGIHLDEYNFESTGFTWTQTTSYGLVCTLVGYSTTKWGSKALTSPVDVAEECTALSKTNNKDGCTLLCRTHYS